MLKPPSAPSGCSIKACSEVNIYGRAEDIVRMRSIPNRIPQRPFCNVSHMSCKGFCWRLAGIRPAIPKNGFATETPFWECHVTTHQIKRRARTLAVLSKLILPVALYLMRKGSSWSGGDNHIFPGFFAQGWHYFNSQIHGKTLNWITYKLADWARKNQL